MNCQILPSEEIPSMSQEYPYQLKQHCWLPLQLSVFDWCIHACGSTVFLYHHWVHQLGHGVRVATIFLLASALFYGKKLTHLHLGLQSLDQHTKTPCLRNYLKLPVIEGDRLMIMFERKQGVKKQVKGKSYKKHIV